MSKAEWPAFPAMHYDLGEHEHGMSLRDYFAAKAMQGVIAGIATRTDEFYYSECAALSYEVADAMLEARK